MSNHNVNCIHPFDCDNHYTVTPSVFHTPPHEMATQQTAHENIHPKSVHSISWDIHFLPVYNFRMEKTQNDNEEISWKDLQWKLCKIRVSILKTISLILLIIAFITWLYKAQQVFWWNWHWLMALMISQNTHCSRPHHGYQLNPSHKQLETHGCIISIVITDVMVLKHQGISIHSADLVLIASDQIHTIHDFYRK